MVEYIFHMDFSSTLALCFCRLIFIKLACIGHTPEDIIFIVGVVCQVQRTIVLGIAMGSSPWGDDLFILIMLMCQFLVGLLVLFISCHCQMLNSFLSSGAGIQ